ncbi:unnamed protein product [Diatraea saccharalis]|uniref:Lipase domain-containing protein n=1 Tax=Diatraea saccharalis TaxID=40085 RepID=A0A9N9RHG2_9NEOP|nr:unnamed protein product [Diatraea saccharalis]
MKLLVLSVLLAVCNGNPVPTIPGDNSYYVEGESRYIWMPDGEGVPHLVDLQEPVDQMVLNSRNGANNQYWLFTRQNPTSPQILVHNNINSVRNSNYAAHRGLKVIVHGWNSNGNTQMNPLITSAFLAVQDVNVIVVDWRQLANTGYNTAASGVPGVGQFLGNFLQWLINNAGGNWNNVHLVGFSLGAHIVGNAGRQAGGRPSRVTGLDPAGPTWGGNPNALNRNAGRFVEAIHTDGGLLGIMNSIADADFYPNGGRNPQPGCWISTCSHGRATELFASSVRQSNRFAGSRCPNIWEAELSTCHGDILHMGNGVINKSGSGLFALRTGNAWPF